MPEDALAEREHLRTGAYANGAAPEGPPAGVPPVQRCTCFVFLGQRVWLEVPAMQQSRPAIQEAFMFMFCAGVSCPILRTCSGRL